MSKKPTFRNILILFLLFLFSGIIYSSFFNNVSANFQEENEEYLSFSQSRYISADVSGDKDEILRRDTNVLLTVDTENITEENKNDFVRISDDRTDIPDNSNIPSEHIAVVDKNMKIYWSAEALNPETGVTVDVLGIFRKPQGGAEILDGVFRDPNNDGIVMGKIKNKKVDGLEYYNIMIRINAETPQTYLIDPKLKMGIE